jgi:phosphate transport system permease protein
VTDLHNAMKPEESAIDRSPSTGAIRPITISNKRSPEDRAFRSVTRAAGLLTFVILFLIGLFLFLKAIPAFQSQGLGFLTNTGWQTTGKHPHFGVLSALTGSIVIAVIALIVAIPVSIACALFISEYAPNKLLGVFPLKNFLTASVDLMAAVPSIIYGMWGFFVLQPHMTGVEVFFSSYLSSVPFLKNTTGIYTSSFLIAGTIVGIMCMPIITSLCREVFSLTPTGEREGAMSLGASRARVIRDVVFPFAKGGMIGSIMLGLGRALGEAIAVAIIISLAFPINIHVVQAGGNSIAALIALQWGSGGPLGTSALLAAGLVLFLITLAINMVASRIVNKSKAGRG